MIKKTISKLMLATLVLSLAAPVVASAEDFDTQIQEKEQKIADIQGQRSGIESQISALQGEISTINQQAEELVAQQQVLGEASQQLVSEIESLTERIAKRESAIQDQVREMQVNGQTTDLFDAVLAAESLSDLLSRAFAMGTIVTANNDLVVQQKTDKEAVEEKKAENESQQQQISENQAQLEAQKGDLVSKQTELDVLTATLALEQSTVESEKAGLEQQKAEAEAAAAALAAQVVAAQAEAEAAQSAGNNNTNNVVDNGDSNSGSNAGSTGGGGISEVAPNPVAPGPVAPPSPNASGSAIVDYAMQFIGVPYVWGGKSPSGFDCSGFCYYVYLNVTGKNIGGWTVPQESSGTIIDISQAQAGDLLFWGSRGSTHHVALAMGGGQYLHAPTFGQTVSISSYSNYAPSFAVRVN
ncbi:peptidoglycan hydrolase CwlO-like protein [Enterococcus sp. PF1-24]|uniref:C40 family peptidase n=1 Tax=unclassified Enterococcus TaxID=2608891 RepID=UPI002472F33B|nr:MULTISPECIES: C40 family peptidase [unclassified Enterococcus]MDH6364259.1 peptidoglycan hydrolase CwlO-like protein [Enterococcus sp. PFB1-1]MDH6401382.1 peptidoglycan hydrolase CwlO-like protein [Enterococcus sp. PF1-24]